MMLILTRMVLIYLNELYINDGEKIADFNVDPRLKE